MSPVECPEHTTNTKGLLDDKIIDPPFTNEPSTNIRSYQKEISKLIPNPANNYVKVLTKANLEEPVLIHCYDYLGNLVKVQRTYQEVVELSLIDLPAGLYFIKWEDKSGSQLERLIIFK